MVDLSEKHVLEIFNEFVQTRWANSRLNQPGRIGQTILVSMWWERLVPRKPCRTD